MVRLTDDEYSLLKSKAEGCKSLSAYVRGLISSSIGSVHPVGSAGVSKSISKNRPCPCGSGLKYKRCCMGRERSKF